MRRELVMSMNVIEFEFLKCHLVNSCVRLYEFNYELEMTLSLRESLRMYSGIVLQFLLCYTTSLKIVCE